MSVLVGTADIQLDELQPDRRVDTPCQFVGAVRRVWEAEDGDTTNLLLLVRGASDPSQLGRVHVETLRHCGGTPAKDRHVRRRLLRFAEAFGLISDADVENGQPVNLDFDAAVGREAVAGLYRRRYVDDDGKASSSLQIGFLDVWRVDDPEGPDRSTWYHADEEDIAK